MTGAAVNCPECELDFGATFASAEAEFLANQHNELHHGGAELARAHSDEPPAVHDDGADARHIVDLAAEEYGEQGREQADEALAQGQGDLWLDLLLIDEQSDAATSVDVDEAGW